MRKTFYIALAFLALLGMSYDAAGQVARPSITPGWGRMVQWILNGQETLAYKTLASPTISGTVTSTAAQDITVSNTTAGGERALDASISHITNALTGDLIGVRGNARVDVASASGKAIGGYFLAGNSSVGYALDVARGVYAGVVSKEPAANITWNTARAYEAIMDLDQGASSKVVTITDAQMFYGVYNLPTVGTYATVTNGYGVRLKNEAVGGNGQALDAALYVEDASMSGGVHGWDYGIDLSGVASGNFGTADIKLANGLTIDNTTNNALELNENSDELIATFGSNTVAISSGDVTAVNFSGGISTTWNGATSGGIKIAPIATGTATATIQNQNVSASTITLPSATTTLPGLSLANVFTSTAEWDGATSGGIKIAPIATGTALTTIQNQNVAAATITLPSATCTLPGLGLANSWSASQTLTGTSYLELDGATSGGIKLLPLAVGTALTTISNQNVAAATITLPSATCTLPGLGLSNDWTGANTFAGTVNHAISGGTPIVSAGLLGGAGTATGTYQTLGAAGGKAFSFYLGSTSTTTSDALTGLYMCMNYGTSGANGAPSGDAIRGRAYLIGDAAGGTMLSGGNFTTELEATTASNTGLTVGAKGNIVFPDGVMTNAGEYYGVQAELYLSGTSVNTTAYTNISPLSVCVSGANPTVTQINNIDAIAFDFPANMVTSDATVVCTGGANDTCDAKLKIDINGTKYWIMLSTDDE